MYLHVYVILIFYFLSVSNRKLFLEVRNSLQDIVQILTTAEDEELVKAVKYVLQISVQKGKDMFLQIMNTFCLSSCMSFHI